MITLVRAPYGKPEDSGDGEAAGMDGAGRTRMAYLIDALRGGDIAFQPEQELAQAIVTRHPSVRRLIAWADRFASRVAEVAVTGGMPAVVFGAAGLPPPAVCPHRAAEAVSSSARFFFPDPDPVITALRAQALEADEQAVAYRASILDPPAALSAVARAGMGDLPVQVQWGLATWMTDGAQGAALAARYAELLHPGSQLVMCAAEVTEGLGELTGVTLHAHSVGDLMAWASGAGLRVTDEIPDVSMWEGNNVRLPRGDAEGRVSAVIAVKP